MRNFDLAVLIRPILKAWALYTVLQYNNSGLENQLRAELQNSSSACLLKLGERTTLVQKAEALLLSVLSPHVHTTTATETRRGFHTAC